MPPWRFREVDTTPQIPEGSLNGDDYEAEEEHPFMTKGTEILQNRGGLEDRLVCDWI